MKTRIVVDYFCNRDHSYTEKIEAKMLTYFENFSNKEKNSKTWTLFDHSLFNEFWHGNEIRKFWTYIGHFTMEKTVAKRGSVFTIFSMEGTLAKPRLICTTTFAYFYHKEDYSEIWVYFELPYHREAIGKNWPILIHFTREGNNKTWTVYWLLFIYFPLTYI